MNKKRLNQVFKQLLIVMIVFSLVFPVNLSAKKKRGAKLWVTMLTGETIKGELLRVNVNEGTLLLMTSAAKTGANININDVSKIRFRSRKKLKWWAGPVVTISVGLISGLAVGGGDRNWTLLGMGFYGVVLGIPAGIITAAIGSSKGRAKEIILRGKSEPEKKRILLKLKSKARFKD